MTFEVAEAIAEDAESLATLHDRELTPDLATALAEVGFPASLGLLPATAERAAWQAMAAGVADLPEPDDTAGFDDLAAEYAAIYLTGAYGASPCESVWTDDDHLVCQDAMFQWRDILGSVGLVAADWRTRADDHLVFQLLYLGHAVRRAASPDDWRAIAHVLDEHTLRWLPDFAARVAARSASPFYAALAVLTAAWVGVARDVVAARLDEPRRRQPIRQRWCRL